MLRKRLDAGLMVLSLAVAGAVFVCALVWMW